MPLLAQNNGIVQNSMDPNDKKAQELNRRIEEAELRGDEKELERLSKEVEQYYMGQLNDAMDLYNKYKNYQGDIPGAENDDDDDDEDHHGGGLFGDQSLFDDHDHDHDHGF